jgi:hypothetical protein
MILICAALIGGCISTSNGTKHANNIKDAAVDVSMASERIRQLEAGVLAQTEVIHNQITSINKDIEVIEAYAPEDVSGNIATVREAVGMIGTSRDSIVSATHAVVKETTGLVNSTKTIVKESKRVRDAPSVFESIGSTLKWLLFISVGIVTLALGWRFGLDRLVSAFAKILAGWVEWFGTLLYRKVDGSAKLMREALDGKIPLGEAVAVLRAENPDFDKAYKESKNVKR